MHQRALSQHCCRLLQMPPCKQASRGNNSQELVVQNANPASLPRRPTHTLAQVITKHCKGCCYSKHLQEVPVASSLPHLRLLRLIIQKKIFFFPYAILAF